jgi:hypothetical protein
LAPVSIQDGRGIIFDLDVKAGAGHVDFDDKDIQDDIDEGAIPKKLQIFLAQQGAQAH